MALFSGSGVALVTPFGEDGAVNFDALGALITHIMEGGTGALFVCGTTGEPSTMTEDERLSVVEYALKAVNKRIPVFAGSGGNNTAAVVEFSRRCDQLGADGLLVVTPYYNKCTQNGLVAHYQAISDAVKIPIVAYNVPTRTGLNITPSTALRLADIPNVRAFKEASGDITQMTDVARLTRGKLDFYCGDDNLTLPAMSLGAEGVISVAANVIPAHVAEIVSLCHTGRYAEARELQFKITPFIKTLFCEVNPIPCKKALQLMGFAAGAPRMPLTEMEPEHAEKLKAEMIKLDLFQ